MVPWNPLSLHNTLVVCETTFRNRKGPSTSILPCSVPLGVWEILAKVKVRQGSEREQNQLALLCQPSAQQPPLQHPEALGSQIKTITCIWQPVFPGFFPSFPSRRFTTSSSRQPALRWHPSLGASLSEKALEITDWRKKEEKTIQKAIGRRVLE